MPVKGKKKSSRKNNQIPAGLILTLLLLACVLAVARVYVRNRIEPNKPLTPPTVHNRYKSVQTFDDRNFVEDFKTSTPEPKRGKKISNANVNYDRVDCSVCLVIDDVGTDLNLAEEAARQLPPSTTFAIIPGLEHSKASAELLHSRGFHIIAHIPMEPEDGDRWKQTPGMLMVGMGEHKASRILKSDLSEVEYAEGINNHMGSRATSDRRLMMEVMKYLKPRGYYFLDSRTSASTVAYQVAKEEGVQTTERRVFLDDVDSVKAITKQIDYLIISAAEQNKTLVAIGHLRPKTIAALSARTRYWQNRGARFVALKEVVH